MQTAPHALLLHLLLYTLVTWVNGSSSMAPVTSTTSETPIIFTTPSQEECDLSQCNNRLLKYYQELGCSPVIPEDACCPTAFNCSSLTERDHNKCYYRGKSYDIHQRVDQNEVSNPCIVSCECRQYKNRATFTCVSAECAELFGPPLRRGCVRLYEPNQCCSSNTYCEDSGGNMSSSLFECHYGGKIYVEGQNIYSDDSHCKSCLCQQGFNGTLDGPWCRELSCDLELHYGDRLLDGCAPIYYGDEVCCPVDWRCPVGDDSVIPASTSSPPNVPDKCTFGLLSLNVGDQLSPSDNPCVICSCSTPPHVSCRQTPHEQCSRPVHLNTPSTTTTSTTMSATSTTTSTMSTTTKTTTTTTTTGATSSVMTTSLPETSTITKTLTTENGYRQAERDTTGKYLDTTSEVWKPPDTKKYFHLATRFTVQGISVWNIT
ncbi:kielin/chordin-like protein [Anabrus simplex]|uniref:kielin/chordin-like protein n=1 Tax=Anabrus simplex TaxID=316456 RepID=UPI0035A386BC